jgi:hypothetical protein
MSKFKTDKVVKLQGKEYVLFEGLLEVTHENYKLMGFETELLQYPSKANDMTAIVKAIVTVKDGEDKKTFSGIGDASPASVNRMIAPHIVRMAETRALGRAMRFLTGFGTVFEELGEVDFNDNKSQKKSKKDPDQKASNNKQDEVKSSSASSNEVKLASKAQLNKIEKDAKSLGLSAEKVYTHLGIDPNKVEKSEASKVIKFLKTDEAKNLTQKTEQSGQAPADGEISGDDLPF